MNNPEEQLDKQLRAVLRREEPSADFTARVLARVQASSEPARERRPFSFFALFRSPLAGWVVAAAAACLLVVIAAGVYHNFRARQSTDLVARHESAQAASQPIARPSDQPAGPAESSLSPQPSQASTGRHRIRSARVSHKQDQLAIAGEHAKEQLELGLFIASSKLNLAERAVSRSSDQQDPGRNAGPDEHRMER